MGRKKKLEPRYLEHKQSGRGRAVYYDAAGAYHDVLLPGAFNSKESVAAYGRLLLDQAVAPRGTGIPAGERDKVSLVEVLDAFHEYAKRRYRKPDGTETSKLTEYRLVIRRLRELYVDPPRQAGEPPFRAADLTPLKLKAARQSWVVDALARNEVNRRAGMVKRIYRWAVSEELVSVAVLNALETVTGLERGQTAARETEPVGPVDDATVDATFPHLNRHIRGLVEFQRLTGCRPGEACALRLCDIDRTGDVWLYKPPHHKTAHIGKRRVIAIGPKAQAILAPFLTDDPQAYLFSPALAVAEVRAARAAGRKVPRYPSEAKRRAKSKVKNPKRRATGHYSTHAFSVAVGRACDVAFPLPADLAPQPKESKAKWWARLTPDERERVKEWQTSHRWHPNQLRHTFATKVRRMPGGGLEAAQVLLGHSKANITEVYAERNEALAVKLAAEVG